jgi:hypothetical protein
MRVVSKFLTADVQITRVGLAGGKLVMEGMVKGFMPMTVELGPGDVTGMARVLSRPLRELVAARLPERLRTLLLPDGEGEGEAPTPYAYASPPTTTPHRGSER